MLVRCNAQHSEQASLACVLHNAGEMRAEMSILQLADFIDIK